MAGSTAMAFIDIVPHVTPTRRHSEWITGQSQRYPGVRGIAASKIASHMRHINNEAPWAALGVLLSFFSEESCKCKITFV